MECSCWKDLGRSWQEALGVDLESLYWKLTDLPHVVAWAAVVRKAGCLLRVEEFPVLHRLRGLENKMFSPVQRTPCPCISASTQVMELYTDGPESLLGAAGIYSQIPARSPSSWWLSVPSGHSLSVRPIACSLSWSFRRATVLCGSWLLRSKDLSVLPNLSWETIRV